MRDKRTDRAKRYGTLVRLSYHVRTTPDRAAAIEQAQERYGITKTEWFERASDLLLKELADYHAKKVTFVT